MPWAPPEVEESAPAGWKPPEVSAAPAASSWKPPEVTAAAAPAPAWKPPEVSDWKPPEVQAAASGSPVDTTYADDIASTRLPMGEAILNGSSPIAEAPPAPDIVRPMAGGKGTRIITPPTPEDTSSLGEFVDASQEFEQLRGSMPTARQQAAKALADAGESANSLPRSVAQGAQDALEFQDAIMHPEAHLREQEQRAIDAPLADTTKTRIGRGVGAALPTAPLMLAGGAAAPAFAVHGALAGVGDARMEAARMREEGQTVTGGQEAAAAVGQGLIGGVEGYAMPKVFKAAEVIPGGVVGRAAGQVGANVVLGQAGTVARNAVARATIDPSRDLTQGLEQATTSSALQGAIFFAMGELGHIYRGKVPAEQTAKLQQATNKGEVDAVVDQARAASPDVSAVPAPETPPAPAGAIEKAAREENPPPLPAAVETPPSPVAAPVQPEDGSKAPAVGATLAGPGETASAAGAGKPEALFSENGPERASRILDPRSRLGVNEQVWASDNPDLALGQGDNRGVTIEFDPAKVRSTERTDKPASLLGAGKEFSLLGHGDELSPGVRTVTIDPKVASGPFLGRLKNTLKRLGFEATTNEDGTISYAKAESPAPVTDVDIPARAPTKGATPTEDEPIVSKEEQDLLTAPLEESPKPETAKPEEKLTSARKAMTTQDRETMGLSKLNSPERRSWQTALDTADEQGIPERAMRLAAEVKDKPRPLSDVETAGMVTKAAQLKNEHAAVMDEIGKSTDPAEVQLKAAEARRIEQDFDLLTDGLRTSGTEKGRALASQKLTLNQDYKLVSVLNRAKAAKGGDLLPPERGALETLTTRLEEHSSRIEELESKLRDREAGDLLRQNRSQRYAKMTPEQRGAELQGKYAKLRELLKAGCNN